jgi:hypothetical protein
MANSHTELTMELYSNNTNDTTTNDFHKLNSRWNLWAHIPSDSDWSKKSYKLIHKFTTLEETIAIIESLPEALIKNCMLFIMRDGILPMWEDSKNRNGGCFSYKVSNKIVCDVWKELSYVLVGETISNNNLFVNCVTGITISPKKNFCIIKIWMTNCENQNPVVVTSDVKGLVVQGCLFKKHTPEF